MFRVEGGGGGLLWQCCRGCLLLLWRGEPPHLLCRPHLPVWSKIGFVNFVQAPFIAVTRGVHVAAGLLQGYAACCRL
jgi:hypothetical protein